MYDVIVVGTGGIGSAALYELARRGVHVLGIDRFPAGHDRGSSHGQTRVIRRSYFEHTDYVPLLNAAYDFWDDLCETTNLDLLHRTGLVYVGEPGNSVIQGVLRSANDHQLEVHHLSNSEAKRRFEGFAVPSNSAVLYEPDAGYLRVEDAIRAQIDQAKRLGVETIHGEQVVRWSATDHGVIVETNRDRYEAKQLILTAGCWTDSLLSSLSLPLRIVRKHLYWYATDDQRYAESSACPCFFYALSDEYIYGFPNVENRGVKVAFHSGGTNIADPLKDKRTPEPAETRRIEQFVAECLPGVSQRQLRHEVCFYTMTPDGHFIIDRHPEHANVVFAAGMSGHGFKFAPAIGRVLAELALDGQTSIDVKFLGLGRRSLKS